LHFDLLRVVVIAECTEHGDIYHRNCSCAVPINGCPWSTGYWFVFDSRRHHSSATVSTWREYSPIAL